MQSSQEKEAQETQSIPWNNETKGLLIQIYIDRGAWARHYSTVRMTLALFFTALAFGFLGYRWETPQLSVGILVSLFCVTGFSLFLFFSDLTFRLMKGQISILNQARQAYGIEEICTRKYSFIRQWSGLPIAIFLLLFLLSVDLFWLWPLL